MTLDRRSAALSRTVSYALRYHPEAFGLRPDAHGWVEVGALLTALRRHDRWRDVDVAALQRIIEESDKRRFEMAGGRIRALYGHSSGTRVRHSPAEPPPVLYHGTPRSAVPSILRDGLLPMRRQFVHLSTDIPTALTVGRRRDPLPTILRIDAHAASNEGVCFYVGNEQVWLADAVPPRFLSVVPADGNPESR